MIKFLGNLCTVQRWTYKHFRDVYFQWEHGARGSPMVFVLIKVTWLLQGAGTYRVQTDKIRFLISRWHHEKMVIFESQYGLHKKWFRNKSLLTFQHCLWKLIVKEGCWDEEPIRTQKGTGNFILAVTLSWAPINRAHKCYKNFKNKSAQTINMLYQSVFPCFLLVMHERKGQVKILFFFPFSSKIPNISFIIMPRILSENWKMVNLYFFNPSFLLFFLSHSYPFSLFTWLLLLW